MAHIDLNIIDSDLSLDGILSPDQLTDADVIAQDIKHRIIESGLVVLLIGQRNKNGIEKVLTEIELLVEQDDRLIPGTIFVNYNSENGVSVKAQTIDYGQAG